MTNSEETIQFYTQGTCCKVIVLKIKENKIIDSDFLGGCQGNLQGIRKLIKGMDIKEVAEKLQGINCGSKVTSCPDQLSKCLFQYIEEKSVTKSL